MATPRAPRLGALITASLVLLDQLKAYLGIDPDDTSQDASLQQALDVAEASILNLTGYTATAEERTERFSSVRATQIVMTAARPIDEALPVTAEARHCDTGWSTVWATVLRPELGKVRIGGNTGVCDCPCGRPWPDPYRWRGSRYDVVRLAYTTVAMADAFGGTVPSDFLYAIMRTAAAVWSQSPAAVQAGAAAVAGADQILSSVSVGSVSESYDTSSSFGAGSAGWMPNSTAGLTAALAPYMVGRGRAQTAW
jgi:Phage gp6-like head-tail connector protein